jgi:hypothetical protein
MKAAGEDAYGNGRILLLPTVVINNAQYRGRLDVPSVVRGICAGFSETTEPAVRTLFRVSCNSHQNILVAFLLLDTEPLQM